MPEGEYRFQVYGKIATGSTDTWPYESTEYSLASESFTVTPAQISISIADGGITASIDATEVSYRLIDIEGSSRGTNPVRDASLIWHMEDGSLIEEETAPTITGGLTHFAAIPPEGAVAVEVSDPDGNTSILEIE